MRMRGTDPAACDKYHVVTDGVLKRLKRFEASA
jgi:hypothetical protein